jgi:hypothetical protein
MRADSGARDVRDRYIDAAVLALAKVAVSLWVLRLGFSHVSDDDFARTVIAQTFAAAPKLDPSGTSWLPLPFWLTGGAMMVLGRSIAVARGVAIALGALSAGGVYLSARDAQVARLPAVVGTLLGLALPWSAWLGAATVPEVLAANLAAAGLVGLLRSDGPRPVHGVLLGLATLCRYEPWTLALGFAVASTVGGIRRRPRALHAFAPALLALTGMVLWMAWNAHAHDGPLHFFDRVAKFRRASESGDAPWVTKVLVYPAAFVRGSPELTLGAAVLVGIAALRSELRRRTGPLLGVMVFAFAALVYGNVRDGAPTHHAERPMLPLFVLVAMLLCDALARAVANRAESRRGLVRVLGMVTAGAAIVSYAGRYRDYPGTGDAARDPQLARGAALRSAAHLTVEPCAYEHFALIAAYGAPERVTTLPTRKLPVTDACPAVDTK